VLKEPHEKLMLALEAWQVAKAAQKMAEDARHEAEMQGAERERLLLNVKMAQKHANQAEGYLQSARCAISLTMKPIYYPFTKTCSSAINII
jgi:hypothetical protein